MGSFDELQEVWNYEYLYGCYELCMEVEYGTIWYLSSFGIESIDIWFETLYFVYGLGLETPKLISC